MNKVLAIFLLIPLAALSQTAQPTPAEAAIARAQEAIEHSPTSQAYNDLALALARRARETSDPAYYDKAHEVLKKSFALNPNNFEGQKIKAWLLLGKHDFAAALELAKSLNKRVPDDVLVYGFLVDAYVETGNYAEAEKAAQWMLDLRGGSVPALARAAYLRELFGDIEGALELMRMSLDATSLSEREDRAWILSQIGHLHVLCGETGPAESALQQAMQVFPDYHYALGNLGKLRMLEKKYDEAAKLFRKRYDMAPHPENLYPLGAALEKAGQRAAARLVFAEFEKKARVESARMDNANRELILYYIDHAKKPAEALRVGRMEAERRQDVFTLDAYAWALYANGEYRQARQQIERVLTVGVREATIFYHAGLIARKAGDHAAARRYLRQAVDLNSIGSSRQGRRSRLSGAQQCEEDKPPGQSSRIDVHCC
jgi:tetratricopeptide (TPR) repeat protein